MEAVKAGLLADEGDVGAGEGEVGFPRGGISDSGCIRTAGPPFGPESLVATTPFTKTSKLMRIAERGEAWA